MRRDSYGEDVASHGRADVADAVGVGLLARDARFRVGLAVQHLDDARYPVRLEEDLALAVGLQLAERLELDRHFRTGRELDCDLIVLVHGRQEGARRQLGDAVTKVEPARARRWLSASLC